MPTLEKNVSILQIWICNAVLGNTKSLFLPWQLYGLEPLFYYVPLQSMMHVVTIVP